jgi:hypothetical protein
VLEVGSPEPDGSVEIRGFWTIEHNGPQPYTFAFSILGDRLLGDYVHYNTLGRPAVKGPIYGARLWEKPPVIAGRTDLPCRSQCRLLCAGAEALRQCEATQCKHPATDALDCGPPSADFVPPWNTAAMLSRWDDGEWRPADGGAACERVPRVLAGAWTIHERLERGDPVEWSVVLLQDFGTCRLLGHARAHGKDHAVVVEVDEHGLWMLYDPQHPDRLRWAMYGWEFAVGKGGGKRPARIQGQRNPS